MANTTIYEDIYQDTEEYRDKIATVDEHGKRIWLYPKKPKGRFYQWRTYVSWGLLVILFGLPFVKLNGEPFVLFNILKREFILFGIHFSPQDFHLFVLAMLTFMIFIVLFTVVYGRIFCGWICPQTIFMEMVFRKIEYWIEGDANAQRRLNKAPWSTDKFIKKAGKQVIFLLISVLIAHTFLSYIIGIEETFSIMTSSPAKNMAGFMGMVAFTGAFYWVFTRIREQVCTTICPYGRLQGVLTDKNTILVSYDFVRGEPRGKLKRKKKVPPKENSKPLIDPSVVTTLEAPEPQLGDCVDCGLCVRVCPTGIDIRDGVQLECINCTACMDACDEIMDKVNRERGLIRYDSHAGIESGSKKLFTTRVKAYSLLLVLLLGLDVFLFTNRSDIETLVLRTPGMLYQQVDETHLSNLYNYQVFNKTGEEMALEFKIKDDIGTIRLIGAPPVVQSNDMVKGAFFIHMEEAKLNGQKNKVVVEVYSEGKLVDKVKTSFLGKIQ